MFWKKSIKASKLSGLIKEIAKAASLVPYGDGALDLGWEELTVSDLLEWMEESL
ncbi:hypothetical protein SBF1_50100 [Candidatus Desulfosporosinus infrequens]|uniref:Uncharacterized protein n=1 Tax=Candidatus Desulfosporosinus infrequens TaxID=2043169 RepID=A0A2U3LHC2_9FIRM|nr:hypothetical protein SBF1_50100 [Candidatus Desulfosporosinus infrequens]